MATFITRTIEGWVVRVRQPSGATPSPAILLFHGLTGDENAMEIFASRIPDHFLTLSLRGPFPARPTGFSWIPKMDAWPHFSSYQGVCARLRGFLSLAESHFSGDFTRVNLMGFSQGAALSYAFALSYPDRVASLAGLSGFMPDGVEDLVNDDPLAGYPAFVTHGTMDNMVPVERARQAVQILSRAGAKVTYCEAEVGHKLGVDCFRALAYFYQNLSSPMND